MEKKQPLLTSHSLSKLQDDLNKIERGEQRIKKYLSAGQSAAASSVTALLLNNNNSSTTIIRKNNNANIVSSINSESNSPNESSNDSLNNNNFLADWIPQKNAMIKEVS